MDFFSSFWQALLAGDTVQSKLFQSLAAILAFVILRRVVTGLAQRGRAVQTQYSIRKTVSYLTYACGFVVVGRIWFTGFESLTTYAGLLSAGLAIALQAPLVNLAGWVFVIWRKPFGVGDRGDVIDQRLFMFSLMELGNWVDADQSTGRVIHVPNGRLFTEAVANYTQGFAYIWNEIAVLVTFESDWRKAKRLLTGIADEHGTPVGAAADEIREAAKTFMIFYTHLTPVVYTSVKDAGVMLTIRYLCEPRGRRGSEQKMWEAILDAFAAESDVDFAYPTQRLYHNAVEGKPGTRPEALYGDKYDASAR